MRFGICTLVTAHSIAALTYCRILYVSPTGEVCPKKASWDFFHDTVAPVQGANIGVLPTKLWEDLP